MIFSICCHEYAHARAALWQGDSTAADEGHLTLNPIKQMGIFSLIMLAFLGIAFGSVPVNPARMKHRYSNMLVSIAGPLTNCLLFILFTMFIALAVIFKITSDGLILFFQLGAIMNALLFILNMLPIPMLDGWSVFAYFFPRYSRPQSEFAKGIMLILILGIFIYINKLFEIALFLTQELLGFFLFIAQSIT